MKGGVCAPHAPPGSAPDSTPLSTPDVYKSYYNGHVGLRRELMTP